MDFEGLFSELAKQPEFAAKVAVKFAEFVEAKNVPDTILHNHRITWNAAAQAGADALAEIVGEMMEKHPFMAKQALKMLNGG